VNTLCESEVLPHKVSDSPETAHVEEGIRIKPVNVGASRRSEKNPQFSQWLTFYLLELEEDGVRIALTIVDTPGFGDNIDNEFAYVGYR
jgi:cell division control protein 11